MERIREIASLLLINPGLAAKMAGAAFSVGRPRPSDTVQRRINDITFQFVFSLDPVIRSMYFGTYEMSTVETMKAVLRPGDTFIDVGANIGYLSAVAAGLVRASGEVHSFEPVPEYHSVLAILAQSNPNYRIVANRMALGDSPGAMNIDITDLRNIGWNTMVPGFMPEGSRKARIRIPVMRLDQYIGDGKVNQVSLIKIDTEGFEFPVLKGLERYFEEQPDRPPIICEIAPPAYPLLGYTLSQLSDYMESHGYHSFEMLRRERIDLTRLEATRNILFLER